MTKHSNLCGGGSAIKNFSNIDVCGAHGPGFLRLEA